MNIRILAIAAVALAPRLCAAEPWQHELLVFPSAEIVRASGVDVADADIDDEEISADVLLSLQKGTFRFFAEYLLTNHEADLERFQVGWEPSADTIVWFGRFHQASSVWNHEHHHGRFLQTSINRPAIENWEDEGGVIPQHFFGTLIESSWHLPAGRGLHTAIGGGLAPFLTPDGLEPLDVTHPSTRNHELGFQARVTFLPDELGDSGAGILLAYNELNWDEAPPPQFAAAGHVDQTVIGVFANFVREPWQVSGVAYHLAAIMSGADLDDDESSIVGYVQAELELRRDFTLFARYEDTSDTRRSAYFSLFPDYVLQSTCIGLRWAVARRHAFTVEIGDSQTALDNFTELRLQWSAALF